MKLIVFLIIAVVIAEPQNLFGQVFDQTSQLVKVSNNLQSQFFKAFMEFRSFHKKVYGNPNLLAQAQAFFLKNFEEVEAHNRAFAQGLFSFKIGVNEFFDADLLSVIKRLCGTVAPLRFKRASQPKPSTFPAGPESIDFSASMQPIVNQGNCGGCWSFATIAQLESLYSRTSSSSYKISQQFLLDCTTANKGCNGGWPKTAMGIVINFRSSHIIFGVFSDYILDNGVTLNSSYPYTSVKESCQPLTTDKTLPKLAKNSVLYNLNGDENNLKNILAQEGPIVVVMNATPLFMKYKSGVFSDPSCPNNCRVNHAVLLIGELKNHTKRTFC